MRNNQLFILIQSIVSDSGITIKRNPSVDHPIPVPVFYRNDPSGSVSQLWPKGNSEAGLFHPNGRSSDKWLPGIQKFLFTLGLDGVLAHGRFVVYADLPTATYLQRQWRRN